MYINLQYLIVNIIMLINNMALPLIHIHIITQACSVYIQRYYYICLCVAISHKILPSERKYIFSGATRILV